MIGIAGIVVGVFLIAWVYREMVIRFSNYESDPSEIISLTGLFVLGCVILVAGLVYLIPYTNT